MTEPCVYAVLLNYRGWRDTIACLETLLASRHAKLRVIVCDNDSGDDSLEHIERWASGALRPAPEAHPRLDRLLGKLQLPVATQRLSRREAEAGHCDSDARLLLVENGANLGFAAGNNVGLRLALADSAMTHTWVLNNDTLVEPDCLQQMLLRLAAEPEPAVCGSVIHFTDEPDRIQAIGGNRFNTHSGVAGCSEGRFLREQDLGGLAAVEARLDYLSGCSMLLPRTFLENVGLMNEAYFLYYEEIDWFTRAAGKFRLCVEPGARLYHREGQSIGSPSWERSASSFADHHLYRSRITFMREHYPRRMVLCYAWVLVEMGKQLVRGRWRHATTVARAAFTAQPAELANAS